MPRIRNVGGVRPQPFFIHASRFKRSNQLKQHGHYKCLKNHALWFEFSTQSSVFKGATTVAKVSLFSTWTQSTVSFYSM